MSGDTAYRWDHLGLDDVHQWASLIDALASADETDEHYGPDDLAEELQAHGLDSRRDTIAVWDADTLIGFGQIRVSHTLDAEGQVRVWLSGGVHPDYRGRGIGQRLFEVSEARGVPWLTNVTQASQRSGVPTGTSKVPACALCWSTADTRSCATSIR